MGWRELEEVYTDVRNDVTIKVPCGNPAPLVVNGPLYVGCSLSKDHPGDHEVKIQWGSTYLKVVS